MFNQHNNFSYLNNPALTKFLNRTYLKKSIMTVNYNAGLDLSLLNFLEALKKNNEVAGDTQLYKNFIDDFSSFVNNELFSALYVGNKEKILKDINYKFKTDDGEVSLMYLKFKEEREVIKINGIR